MTETIVTQLALIGVVSIICQVAAWVLRLPAILFLLLGGILAGPVTGWLDPQALFGDLLFPLVSLLVAVVLFEGSLTLRFDEIQGLERVVRRMVTFGMLSTWAVTTLATYWILSFPFELALLFGAITVVTGPTVIVPMLRTVRPNARISNILRWEGIVIDPIGALLAVLVFEFIILSGNGGDTISHTVLTFFITLVVGTVIGGLAGHALGLTLRHHWLPEYLHNITTLTLLFAVFALSNEIQPEAGLLTVTVMGMWLANMRAVDVAEILNFKESLSLVFISGLFIILAARLDFGQVQQLGWASLGVLLVMMLVARPLKILISAWGSKLTWRERALLAWIAPRGIVAAAISALFSLKLQESGFEQAELLVPLTFLVIIGTVVVQSATSRPLAQWLGVVEPEPKGFLIVGANPVARTIAKALAERDFRVVLADNSWENIHEARMAGLEGYYGSLVSEHADRYLDLAGIGGLLALSPLSENNSLAGLRYRREFGARKVYMLQTSVETKMRADRRVPERHRGYTLFGDGVTFSKLASWINRGATVHATTLTESFDFERYGTQYGKQAIPLFALDAKGRLQAFVVNGKMEPEQGWTILALVHPAAE